MKQKSIESLFLDVCDKAMWDGANKLGSFCSIRREREHPCTKPGYFYNKLPEDVKERLKNELKSEHTQTPLAIMISCGQVTPWWDHKYNYRKDKEKFELELMKHGWKPDFSHKI